MARHARGTDVALLFIDLDHFKAVNDTHGHAVGDEVLQHTARLLTSATRAVDTVARLGGDEFVILCEDTNPVSASIITERILEAFSRQVTLDRHQLQISASIGVAAAGQHHSPHDLLAEADAAMYLAKEAGGNRSATITSAHA